MPTRGNYICANCLTEMRPEKNGVLAEELFDDGAPYKLWMADLFRCEQCNARVISGFARTPLAEHFQPDYARQSADAEFRFGARIKGTM